MKKEKIVKKIPYIDYECKIGEKVKWSNIKNEQFEGVIQNWNENIATVKLSDGSEIDVLC